MTIAVVGAVSTPREQVGDRPGTEQCQRAAVGPEREARRVCRDRDGDPARGPDHEQPEDRERPVAALEEPAVEGDNEQRRELVDGARKARCRRQRCPVGERRGEDAPPMRSERVGRGQVRDRHESGSRRDPDAAGPDHKQPGRVGWTVGGDPRDLVPTQSPQRRRRHAARARDALESLVELRRALAQPRAAIGTLGDIRTHLGAAFRVLAHDEKIGRRHDCGF